MISYEERLGRIASLDDIQKQINSATAYYKRLRTEAKAFNGSFKDKLALHEKSKRAREVVDLLKRNYYMIADNL